ncbi:hypothetical protein OZX56_03370 [Lactobacillus sp. ESL0684]|uniref:hypothetical protein n=1 Tax=Lactobacillus sp. ESL0684 TaxID=2983213 RepID=UPI0023F86609|nr:hypothetical protein [Lactobacillus sp. ESL0684]WEV44282.1 hypothetical protein OZX56_03370 [Lactobacillus sp. ESL0684]
MAKEIKDKDGITYVQKKPWYKRFWVWVLIVVVVFCIIGGMSSGSDDESSNSNDNSSSKTTQQSKKTTFSKPKKAVVEKNTAKLVTLGAGTYTVGRDIEPGRYTITAASGSGNLSSDNESNDEEINVILGTTVDNDMEQITSYTVDLTKDEKIKIESIQSTKFVPTPNKRKFQTTLGAGHWEVGKDIKPGRYEITALQGSGNLISNNGEDDINEILGTTADEDSGQITKVTADLVKGEILNTDLQEIKLTAE